MLDIERDGYRHLSRETQKPAVRDVAPGIKTPVSSA
jgi:hypothetical protein